MKRRRTLQLASTLALTLLGASGLRAGSSAIDPLDYGPARLREQFLPAIGFMAFEPEPATLLPPGEWQVEVHFSVSNAFAQSDNIEWDLEARTERQALGPEDFRSFPVAEGDRGVFQVDAELYHTTLRARRGLGERHQISVSLPLISFSGGWLDSVVEEFHDLTKNDQEGRSAVPLDIVRIYLRSDDLEIYRDEGSGLEVGDMAVALTRRLGSEARRSRWALEAKIKLPTGRRSLFAGTGAVDFGVRLLNTRRYGDWRIDGGLGILHLGAHDQLRLPSQQIVSAFLGFEHRLGARTTGFVQSSATLSPLEELGLAEFRRPSIGWAIGLKRSIGENVTLILAGSENVASYDNSPDIGLHLGVAYTGR